MFLASLAVNIILWPLLLYYFGTYNTISILLNLLILPLLPVILVLIILGISLGTIGFISKIFYIPLYFIFEYFYIIASLDFSDFYLSLDISSYFVILYYLCILLYFQITKNRLKKNLLFVKNI
jgi:competence protein ComEC